MRYLPIFKTLLCIYILAKLEGMKIKMWLQKFLAPLFNSMYLDFSLFHFNYYNFTITYGLGHAFDLFVVITVRNKKKDNIRFYCLILEVDSFQCQTACYFHQCSIWNIWNLNWCFGARRSLRNWLVIQREFICFGNQNSFHEMGFMPYRASLGLFCHLLNSITSGIGIEVDVIRCCSCFKVEQWIVEQYWSWNFQSWPQIYFA